MSLRIEVSGEEKVDEIKRIAYEYWSEGEFILRKGFLILYEDETVSDVILKDETVDVLDFDTVRCEQQLDYPVPHTHRHGRQTGNACGCSSDRIHPGQDSGDDRIHADR